MRSRKSVLALALLAAAAACGAAAAPRPLALWIAPRDEAGAAVFHATLDLPAAPDRAMACICVQQRYRLRLNGRIIGVGDTGWADPADVTPYLRAGSNAVDVEVQCDPTPAPENAWVCLERDLPAPVSADRLVVRTAGAMHDEWLYLEVEDVAGHNSGFYCLEKGRPDLELGTQGAPAEHVIRLREEPRLEPGASGGCNFDQIARVRIRVDQKWTSRHPVGRVEFPDVHLEGAASCNLSNLQGWRIASGEGDQRHTAVVPAEAGFAVMYDWRPVVDSKVAFEVLALKGGREIGRLLSGPASRTDAGPAVVLAPALTGAGMEAFAPPRQAVLRATVDGGRDRVTAGEAINVAVRILASHDGLFQEARLQIEDWSRKLQRQWTAPLAWKAGAATCLFRVPGLPRGLYRLTVTPGPDTSGKAIRMADRHLALAVLAPGARRVASVFDTLTPFGHLRRGFQGVDTCYLDSPTLLMAYRDLGVNFLDVHIEPSQLDNGELAELFAFCKATRTRFTLNNEASNWEPSALRKDGSDRMVAADGCHRWDLEPDALRAAAATGVFEGVVYDEGEHMQISRNAYSGLPDKVHRKPYLVETTGMMLPQAYDAYWRAAADVVAYNKSGGGRMVVESVFPVLWHPLARGGVTLCPKLLKEDVQPVVLAMALGAVKEYGATLWLSPDLWYFDRMPGHTVTDYRQALELADRTGVSNVYTEYVTALCEPEGNQYDVTPYGQALRGHIRRLAARKRPAVSYRAFRPEVAIIRFPDSDWGQESCYYWNMLYGAENLHSTLETREWLQLWHVLSGGATDPRAVNANSDVYPKDAWRFHIPSPKVAVYDHLVGEGPLASVRTLFLCGVELSVRTRVAVRKRVRAGAVCFAPTRFCPSAIAGAVLKRPARVSDGKGAWIVVDGFTPRDLGKYRALIPHAR